ncbi:MAG TPA: methyltransferase domain-containing protein [Candidatus Methylomirabilis sp.]|nr:methyltransferase domain-containing protein [Candidatus Methylomirabilis sp.]
MPSPPIDPEAFRAFEHEGWERVPQRYHNAFASLTSQTIAPLLDALGATTGVRLLDVATGPGYAAAAAAERGAKVIGIDFAPAMVAEARQRYPTVDFREGDAEDLPFPEASFDAVIMNFGLLHLARPERALAEAHRVLHPEGRFGFTVWARPEQAIGFQMVLRAVERYGKLDVGIPQGPHFFRFSDPQECQRSLLDAGFISPAVKTLPLIWRLSSPDALFESMFEGTVRTAGLLRAQSADAIHAIRKGLRQAVLPYQKGVGVELPMPAVLASARKP